jgi:acid phosphatase
MKYKTGIAVSAGIIIGISGCATIENNNLNSTLWVQSSSEYKANSIQIYNMAKNNLALALQDTDWTAALEQTVNYATLPAAVIMDIDETVLDNANYQAKLVIERTEFNFQTWDDWIFLKNASPIPGAVDFIRFAKDKNVEVIFITNRACTPRKNGSILCPQEQNTIDNLAKVGVTGVKHENILLKNEQSNWSSEKKSRREAIVTRFRVLMLFGDDLGDFLPNVKKSITPQQRDELVYQYKSNWGWKWYMFSNPTYGSWLRVLPEPKLNYLVGY